MNQDLGQLNTEAIDSRFSKIDTLSTLELLKLFNESDKSVAEEVAKVLPRVADAISEITRRMESGGRLIYVGAGTSGRLGVLDASECIPTFSLEDGLVIGLIAGGDTALRTGIEGAEDVFGIIWPYNFMVLGIASYQVSQSLTKSENILWLVFFGLSVAAALTWAYQFYVPHNLTLAPIALTLCALLTLPVLYLTFKATLLMGLLLVPYQIWVAIAASLAWGYSTRN